MMRMIMLAVATIIIPTAAVPPRLCNVGAAARGAPSLRGIPTPADLRGFEFLVLRNHRNVNRHQYGSPKAAPTTVTQARPDDQARPDHGAGAGGPPRVARITQISVERIRRLASVSGRTTEPERAEAPTRERQGFENGAAERARPPPRNLNRYRLSTFALSSPRESFAQRPAIHNGGRMSLADQLAGAIVARPPQTPPGEDVRRGEGCSRSTATPRPGSWCWRGR